MRYIEYLFFFALTFASYFLATPFIKETWSPAEKRAFRYFVPFIVFITLSFLYVLTGERTEEMIAKFIFCPLYQFNACAKAIPTKVIDKKESNDFAPLNAVKLSVPAQIPWGGNTGIVLTAGDQVSITAAGSVYIGAQQNHVLDNETPNGQPWDICAYGNNRVPFVAPGLNCWSLVGRIGVSGGAFEIGSQRTFIAPSSGQLFLSVNDNVFGDNSGFWSVTVQVTRSR